MTAAPGHPLVDETFFVANDVTTHPDTRGLALARTLCALVAFAAGIVGVAMLISPESTGSFFSWALGPPPLAAMVGAFYVASALIFGWAAFREQWSGLRPLCTAVFGLTVPTLVSTYRHRDVFDFGRWQAVAWVVLFIGSVVFFTVTLIVTRVPVARADRRLAPLARTALAVLAFGYAALAMVLWLDPALAASYGPVAAGGLGVRFVGSWAAFLAVLAAIAALRPGWMEARIPVLALTLWPLAALLAALPHLGVFRPDTAVPYLSLLTVLTLLPAVIVLGRKASG